MDRNPYFHCGLLMYPIAGGLESCARKEVIYFLANVQSDRMAGGVASRSKVCVFPPFGRLSCSQGSLGGPICRGSTLPIAWLLDSLCWNCWNTLLSSGPWQSLVGRNICPCTRSLWDILSVAYSLSVGSRGHLGLWMCFGVMRRFWWRRSSESSITLRTSKSRNGGRKGYEANWRSSRRSLPRLVRLLDMILLRHEYRSPLYRNVPSLALRFRSASERVMSHSTFSFPGCLT